MDATFCHWDGAFSEVRWYCWTTRNNLVKEHELLLHVVVMFRTALGLRVGPSQHRKSDREQLLTGRRPSLQCISLCAHYKSTLYSCSIAARLQSKSIIQVVHCYRHGHTGGCTR